MNGTIDKKKNLVKDKFAKKSTSKPLQFQHHLYKAVIKKNGKEVFLAYK